MWRFTVVLGCAVVLAAVLVTGPFQSQATYSSSDLTRAICVGHGDASGTIYMRRLGDDEHLWSLDVSTGRPRMLDVSTTGEPSRALHNGQRWFLTTMELPQGRYADGGSRRELFAVSENGRAVQLTTQADLEPSLSSARWPAHGADTLVSWVAYRRTANGQVGEGGIFVAELQYNEKGDIVGLTSQPTSPLLNLSLACEPGGEAGGEPPVEGACNHDWSPDGKEIVYETSRQQLWITDVQTGGRRLLTPESGYDPAWAADGSTVAFKVLRPLGAIRTVHPDGTPVATIAAGEEGESVVYAPTYSPDAKLLAYARLRRIDRDDNLGTDICLKTPSGVGRGNVILELPPMFAPVAWR